MVSGGVPGTASIRMGAVTGTVRETNGGSAERGGDCFLAVSMRRMRMRRGAGAGIM